MSLRRVRDALGRSIGLEQRAGQLHVVLIDPQRAPAADLSSPLSQVRTELRARLFIQQLDPSAPPMRHLGFVHEVLGREGWPGIDALPRRVLGRALVQAELLDSLEPSPLLVMLIERLRAVKLAREMREERVSQLMDLETLETLDVPEVSETNYEEFELMERSWAGTIPAALKSPDRDK